MEYNSMNSNDVDMSRNSERPVFVGEKRSGCLADGLKVGCGFIMGIVCAVVLSSLFSYFASASKMNNYNSENVQYFNVRSKKGKATIHTGMPKDSVILLLGEPTEFMSSDFIDEITYRYGNYDLNSLRIEFRKGKVKSVSQH